MADPVDPTPLLEDSSNGGLKQGISACKLQEKCFLSNGVTQGSTDSYKKVQRKLVIACILCFIFMAVEVVGGYIARSVAIMSDAAHMLSDVSAFLVSIFATWAATQPSTWHYSFGYHRAEILGALISVLTIWAVTGALLVEAFQRTVNPVKVDGKLMFIISIAGVIFNILIMLTLGVHGHLGHSHGPDGCHGHSHSHDHDHDHDHSHDHGHGKHGCGSHAHSHPHSEGGKHGDAHDACNGSSAAKAHNGSSSHASKEQSSSGGCGGLQPARKHQGAAGGHHGHDHEHGHEQEGHGNHSCSHGHSHSHDSSDDSYSNSAQEAAHDHSDSEHEHAGHSHDCSHDHSHAEQSAAAGSSGAAGKECVINVPAAAGAGCGGVACTISKTGSREIEVRYELPLPAAAAAAAAGGPGGPHSRSSAGHGHSHDHGSINLRGAVLHVIGDLLQSIGVAIAGGLIWLNQDDPRWYLADPICTFVFSIVVLLTTKSILRDIVHVLMERTPPHMDVPTVAQGMGGMEGVWDIHDLHIWNISTGMKPVLTAHVHIGPDAEPNVVLQQLEAYVRRLGIDHSTIQICNVQPQLEQPAEQAEV